MSLDSVSRGSWCPLCVRKTEAKLYKWLCEVYPGEVTREVKYDWCINRKTGRKLPFDFCLENRRILIELDGAQHFKQVKNWAPPKETQARDRLKERLANENGYTAIRLIQEEVLFDRNQWQQALSFSIARTRNEPTVTLLDMGAEVDVTYLTEISFG